MRTRPWTTILLIWGVAVIVLFSALLWFAFPTIRNLYDFFFGDGLTWFRPWTLEFVQEQFIGSIPPNATNVEYTDKDQNHSYALLSFSAPPAEADEFVSRFCFGRLFRGYDPFNAIDNVEDDLGHPIRTEPAHYYFSYSPDTSSDVYGNRCYENTRGGLLQIRIDRSQMDFYHVKLEISGYCQNPIAQHPCDGHSIDFFDMGTLDVEEEVTILSRLGGGSEWEISVEENQLYRITLVPLFEVANESGHASIATFPNVNENQAPVTCDDCRITVQGNVGTDGLSLDFAGTFTGKAFIWLFWMSGSFQPYMLRVSNMSR